MSEERTAGAAENATREAPERSVAPRQADGAETTTAPATEERTDEPAEETD